MGMRHLFTVAAVALIVGGFAAQSWSAEPSKAVASPKLELVLGGGQKVVSKTPKSTKSPARNGEAKSVARFQMLKAGERVVILDTQTGQTQIIEPEARSAVQQVDVGRAWVVVTVLGNASSITRGLPPAPLLPE